MWVVFIYFHCCNRSFMFFIFFVIKKEILNIPIENGLIFIRFTFSGFRRLGPYQIKNFFPTSTVKFHFYVEI